MCSLICCLSASHMSGTPQAPISRWTRSYEERLSTPSDARPRRCPCSSPRLDTSNVEDEWPSGCYSVKQQTSQKGRSQRVVVFRNSGLEHPVEQVVRRRWTAAQSHPKFSRNHTHLGAQPCWKMSCVSGPPKRRTTPARGCRAKRFRET